MSSIPSFVDNLASESIDPSEDNSIVIVCASDNGYAMPLAVTMRSVVENVAADRKILLYIIDGGIEAQNKDKILKTLVSEKCAVHWLPKPDASIFQQIANNSQVALEDMPVSQHITVAAYYRILISELLPRHLNKAIYLDCDLIITTDLGELWDIEIGENYALAVQEVLTPYVSSPCGVINYRELGLAPDCPFMTSGVLVLNLEKWRTDELSARCINYIYQNKQYVRSWDTDVLNAVIAGKWEKIPPKWNQMPFIYECKSWKDSPYSESEFHEAVHNPAIVHYATSAKPWNSFYKHPFRHLFYQYLDKTEWSGWRFTVWQYVWREIGEEAKRLKTNPQEWMGHFWNRLQRGTSKVRERVLN